MRHPIQLPNYLYGLPHGILYVLKNTILYENFNGYPQNNLNCSLLATLVTPSIATTLRALYSAKSHWTLKSEKTTNRPSGHGTLPLILLSICTHTHK
jgi:hypothetical protein